MLKYLKFLYDFVNLEFTYKVKSCDLIRIYKTIIKQLIYMYNIIGTLIRFFPVI